LVPFINASGNPAQETITVNAGESTAYGVEVEATWLATENFTLDHPETPNQHRLF
jgi:outer membrane receptor protein involved in Fe transport